MTLIAIDFDGTIVKNAYPHIGEDIGAFPWLHKWQDAGAELMLWSCRDGMEIHAAVAHCFRQNIEFAWVNSNDDQKSESRKLHAHIYVDDKGAGIPLVIPFESKPWVDWNLVGPMVLAQIIARGMSTPTL